MFCLLSCLILLFSFIFFLVRYFASKEMPPFRTGVVTMITVMALNSAPSKKR